MPEGHAHPSVAPANARADWLYEQRARATRPGPDMAHPAVAAFLKVVQARPGSVLVINSGSDGELLAHLNALGVEARGLAPAAEAMAFRENHPALSRAVSTLDLDAAPDAPRDHANRFAYAYVHRFEEAVNDYGLLVKTCSALARGGIAWVPFPDSAYLPHPDRPSGGVFRVRDHNGVSMQRLLWLAGFTDPTPCLVGELEPKTLEVATYAAKPDKPIWGMSPDELSKGWPP